MFRKQVLGVKDDHPRSRQDNSQPKAEGQQQHHPQTDPADRNSAEQQNERGRARHQSAARPKCDEAPDGDVTLRHMGMSVAIVGVGEGAV